MEKAGELLEKLTKRKKALEKYEKAKKKLKLDQNETNLEKQNIKK